MCQMIEFLSLIRLVHWENREIFCFKYFYFHFNFYFYLLLIQFRTFRPTTNTKYFEDKICITLRKLRLILLACLLARFWFWYLISSGISNLVFKFHMIYIPCFVWSKIQRGRKWLNTILLMSFIFFFSLCSNFSDEKFLSAGHANLVNEIEVEITKQMFVSFILAILDFPDSYQFFLSL